MPRNKLSQALEHSNENRRQTRHALEQSNENQKQTNQILMALMGVVQRISRSDTSLNEEVLQGLGEQKRTKYKINGTATTAIEKSNPNRPAKSRLPYSYQEHEQGEQQRQPRDSHQLPQTESVT